MALENKFSSKSWRAAGTHRRITLLEIVVDGRLLVKDVSQTERLLSDGVDFNTAWTH